jgi:hypothetical protein
MNNEENLNAFYARIEEIVETKRVDEWDGLIENALLVHSVEWTGDVAATVEILCGGDCIAVEATEDAAA